MRINQGKYQDIPCRPLYEFAHGLSYTTYEYGTSTASATTLKRKEKLIVEISGSNTGAMDGAETVHWFIRDPVSSASRPVKELKYSEKQLIRQGESRIFCCEIDPERDFSLVDATGKRFLETGEYQVIVKDQIVKIQLAD